MVARTVVEITAVADWARVARERAEEGGVEVGLVEVCEEETEAFVVGTVVGWRAARAGTQEGEVARWEVVAMGVAGTQEGEAKEEEVSAEGEMVEGETEGEGGVGEEATEGTVEAAGRAEERPEVADAEKEVVEDWVPETEGWMGVEGWGVSEPPAVESQEVCAEGREEASRVEKQEGVEETAGEETET